MSVASVAEPPFPYTTVVRLRGMQQPVALTAKRLIERTRIPVPTGSVEVSCSAQTKKSTQLCGHTHANLAIKASISARNAANLCSDLLD